MDFRLEEQLHHEEGLYLFRQLLTLTQSTRLHWRCSFYFPWELMPYEDDETAQEIVVHGFDADTECGGKTYRVSIQEGIGVCDGRSIVTLDFVSGDLHYYFYTSNSPLLERLAFSGAVLEQILDTPLIADEMRRVSHSVLCAPNDSNMQNPLVKYCAHLRTQGSVLTFHRLVVQQAVIGPVRNNDPFSIS